MPAPTESMIGRSLAHYRILSRLGRGGMGEVWVAGRTLTETIPPAGLDADRLLELAIPIAEDPRPGRWAIFPSAAPSSRCEA